MTLTPDDPLLKPAEAAEYSRHSVGHLAQLRHLGKSDGISGPSFLKPTPRTVLYRRSALDAWLTASEQQPPRGASSS